MPAPTIDAELPETLQTLGVNEENFTGSFDEAVAANVTDAPGVFPTEGVLKVIV